MRDAQDRRWNLASALIGQIAVCISAGSFFFYLRHDSILLYGDAVAHINIARRIFDSRTPGLLQLGTVWLPLPHLLVMPFVAPDWLWSSGIGGSIPSLAFYVVGVVGVFRLVRLSLSWHSSPDRLSIFAAVLGSAIYALNPNLIYLQATAMTESVYLALFVWAVVFFAEFARGLDGTVGGEPAESSSLLKCGACLAAACLTRYDGWFLTVATGAAAILAGTLARRGQGPFTRELTRFALLAAAAPALWLGYNAAVYRNPLEFANGPYSAKAIEQRTTPEGSPPHPGTGSLMVSTSYFLKAARMNMAERRWQGTWLLLLLAGTLLSLISDRRLWPLLLLWVPIPFYTLSIAYGGVPIFIPVWWPFTIYNARYGIEMLPAFAVFSALAFYFLTSFASNTIGRTAIASAVLFFVAGSYASVWRAQPICFREAWVNSRSRIALETALAGRLQMLPRNATFLMYLGDHVGALQRADISLRHVINEGNHRTWRHPSDSEGLWEHALADPMKSVDYVVVFDGDMVANGVERKNLTEIFKIHTPGQANATIYSTHSEHTQSGIP